MIFRVKISTRTYIYILHLAVDINMDIHLCVWHERPSTRVNTAASKTKNVFGMVTNVVV